METTRLTCKGTNCGATDGRSHSRECHAEHEAIAFEAAQQDHIKHGGWKCEFCGFNGQDNTRQTRFCDSCRLHR